MSAAGLDGAAAVPGTIRAVAAVDLGATSGRVMIGRVGDDTLALEEVARFPNGPVERADGWHWDIEALWGHVRAGLSEALRREPSIESVGIDSWAVDYGLLRGGELLAEPFHYRDARTARGVDTVHAAVPFQELYRRNGLQFLPFNTLYQYAVDGHLADADASVLIPDLIAQRLTGVRSPNAPTPRQRACSTYARGSGTPLSPRRWASRHPFCRRWWTRARRSARPPPTWARCPSSRSGRTTRRRRSSPFRCRRRPRRTSRAARGGSWASSFRNRS